MVTSRKMRRKARAILTFTTTPNFTDDNFTVIRYINNHCIMLVMHINSRKLNFT